MSKSKIILASLGVVAGLGTAALPLASYATQTQQSVSGNVDLYVEVQPAIAMTITGNNDTNASAGAANSAAPVAVKNPTDASTINGQDVSTYEVDTATKASSSYLSILPNTRTEGNDTNNFKSTITVYTNSTSGYALTVKDSDTDTDLDRITTAQDTTADSIPASATFAAGANAGWAYKVGSEGSWTAIVASDAQTPGSIKSTDTKTTGGDASVVYYGVATKADQATGVYTDTIVYTATTH